MMLNTNRSTIKPKVTMNEALNASLMPFRRLSMFGINLSSRKDLNARIVLNDNRMLALGNSNPKTLIQDGSANITSMKSKRFQPSLQYPEKPRTCILITASNRNKRVNKPSMIRRVSPCFDRKPLINIMLVLRRTNTSIICSFVKKRFTDSIYAYRFAASINCFLNL